MAQLPKTKKEFIKALNASNITKINGKALKKLTVPVIKAEFFKHFPDLAPKVEAKKEVKKEASKQEVKKQEKEAIKEIANMSSAEIMQMAQKVAVEAKLQGEKNAKEITKPTKARKSKWSDVIPLLLASTQNQNKDGSYTFSLQEVIDLTGMPTREEDPKKKSFGKIKSWVGFSGDWKPTYKGLGSNIVLLGYKAQVKGAPSTKDKRLSFDESDNSWNVTLYPISLEDTVKLMEPRLKGKIKQFVYTQQQLDAVKAKIESQEQE